ncbi:MAG: class I SAM-dependent methyltransferase [Lachnospiraceae bacterium]|nr:class I SAM-dependent methyltransferase [Lachnospiraceae bacterium]
MSYIDIARHYENCYRMYGDNNRGVDWPNKEDVDTRYQVILDVMKFDRRNDLRMGKFSLLDFGCGLGHLYEYIEKNNVPVLYSGLDISPLFTDKCKEKFPDVEFITLDLLEDEYKLMKYYDYIVLNGVFTEKRDLVYEEMFEYFKELISKIWRNTNRGIAFNVMSKDVDWEREDLFHLSLSALSGFLTKEITRNFIIRNDYGLYEYMVYVYK